MSAAEGMPDQLRVAQQRAGERPLEQRAALELPVLLQVWNSRREEDRGWWSLPELLSVPFIPYLLPIKGLQIAPPAERFA